MRHINIPVFIPHLGCQNDCIFCNQRTISGTQSFDPYTALPHIESKLAALPDGDNFVELAYFGGSFTGLEKHDMQFLLKIVRRLLDEGKIDAARISTRPDYINSGIILKLKEAGISTVELGVQSMSDCVLEASRRGHTSSDTVRAFKMLRDSGMKIVGQMMIGLPLSTRDDEKNTARAICDLGACGARIYPLAVLRRTELEKMNERGEYTPLPLGEAVSRAADALEIFDSHNVDVLRIGLCAENDLFTENGIAAGEYSPATGELVMGELFYRRIRAAIKAGQFETNGSTLLVYVPLGAVSKAVGHKGVNRAAIKAEYKFKQIQYREDSNLSGYNCKVKIILKNVNAL